jgi:hypothetical protein
MGDTAEWVDDGWPFSLHLLEYIRFRSGLIAAIAGLI